MTIWIDPPAWPAHGRLWSHVISDRSLEELHEFARRVGIPARGFEGDHYDVPAEWYADVVAAGAQETSGRDLLRRLRDSGLRMSKRKGDKGVQRIEAVTFPDGTSADVDLITSPREMAHERVFAAMVLVQDGTGEHLLTWSERRNEWSSPGGWREGEEAPVLTAVRETWEEAGLELDPARLQPVGYERFRHHAHTGAGLWVPGRDVLQLYVTRLQEARPTVRPETVDSRPPQWVDDAELEARCSGSFWWPLAAEVLSLARRYN